MQKCCNLALELKTQEMQHVLEIELNSNLEGLYFIISSLQYLVNFASQRICDLSTSLTKKLKQTSKQKKMKGIQAESITTTILKN